jgi:hypothetical protein
VAYISFANGGTKDNHKRMAGQEDWKTLKAFALFLFGMILFLFPIGVAVFTLGIEPSYLWAVFAGVAVLLAWVTYEGIRNLIFHLSQKDTKGALSEINSMILLLLLLPSYFAGFSLLIYPNIPLHIGGGAPREVELIGSKIGGITLRNAAAELKGNSQQRISAQLFLVTDDDLYVKLDNRRSLIVRRSSIDAIVFGSERKVQK